MPSLKVSLNQDYARLQKQRLCRNLFMKLKILPLPSQYTYFLFSCLWSTTETNILLTPRFTTWTLDNTQNFHKPLPSLTKCEKGTYCPGIKVYDGFLLILKMYLIIQTESSQKNSFYSLDEYFQFNKKQFLSQHIVCKLSTIYIINNVFIT